MPKIMNPFYIRTLYRSCGICASKDACDALDGWEETMQVCICSQSGRPSFIKDKERRISRYTNNILEEEKKEEIRA